MNKVAKTYVGVDISKKYLDVSLYPSNESFRENNDKEGVNNLLKKLKKYNLEIIACEASGGYENLFAKLCTKANEKIRIEDPRRIRDFAKAKGIKAKTDSIDASVIASFASTFPVEYEKQNLSGKHLELQELVKYRDRLKKSLSSEKMRLGGPVYSFSEKYIKKHIVFLQKQIKMLNTKIEAIINSIEELKEKSILIQTMPGVGKDTAISLISYLPELGTLGPKKVASLLGVAPFNKESGQYRGVTKIKDGRSKPRSALYMAALSSSRHCPVFMEFYNRLVEKGKPKKKALVAVMRRMAVVLDAMVANKTEWIDKTI